MLEEERRRRLSGVCFRSDLFHKWFSPVRRVGSADTFSFVFDRAENKQRVTYGIKNKTNVLHVNPVFFKLLHKGSFFIFVLHIKCHTSYMCVCKHKRRAFFSTSMLPHTGSVHEFCVHTSCTDWNESPLLNGSTLLQLWPHEQPWCHACLWLMRRHWSLHTHSSVRDVVLFPDRCIILF